MGERRQLLFALACAALILAAIAFSGATVSDPPPASAPGTLQPQPATRRTPTRGLRRSATRFLIAFLRYELGDPAPTVRRDLRATTTSSFAAELLATPPAPSASPQRSHITRLQLTPLSANPPRALVSGSAGRGSASEPFAFLFALRRAGWRASAPAE